MLTKDEKTQVINVENEKGYLAPKIDKENTTNNSVLINLIAQIKRANCLKNTNYQGITKLNNEEVLMLMNAKYL